MKKYLKTLAVAALLSASALSHAAPLTVGAYSIFILEQLQQSIIHMLKTWRLK